MRAITIQKAHWEQMRAHVNNTAPVEACGLVAGKENQSQRVFPITNELNSKTRYRMAPNEQVQAMHTIAEKDWDLLAIYHSHPDGPARPSQTDLRESNFDETIHLIWSGEGEDWVLNAFLFGKDGAQPLEVTVEIDDSAT